MPSSTSANPGSRSLWKNDWSDSGGIAKRMPHSVDRFAAYESQSFQSSGFVGQATTWKYDEGDVHRSQQRIRRDPAIFAHGVGQRPALLARSSRRHPCYSAGSKRWLACCCLRIGAERKPQCPQEE